MYPISIHNIITKLYVSKMNENKERIPTKYTWNPSDNNIFLKTAARRYSLASWYCNGTSTHLYVINDLQNIVKLYTLLSRFTGMEVIELFLHVWRLHFSIAPVTQQRGRCNILRRYNVYFPVNFFYLWHSSREQQGRVASFTTMTVTLKPNLNLNIPLYLKVG